MAAFTVREKVLPLHFLILSNFHITALTSLGESIQRTGEDIALSGMTTRKQVLCASSQQ